MSSEPDARASRRSCRATRGGQDGGAWHPSQGPTETVVKPQRKMEAVSRSRTMLMGKLKTL